MIETEMAKMFKAKLKGEHANFHKIETGSTLVGVPDWHIRTEYKDIWIEAKEIKYWPKMSKTRIKIDYRPGQYNWLMKHRKLNGFALLVATFGDDWYLFHDIRLDYTIREFEFLNLIDNDFKNTDKDIIINILNKV